MEHESEKHGGYMFKLEHTMVGQSRKKYWFVLPFDTPTLYWFKNSSDFDCIGRLSLSGAAFTFNPRDMGIFEIHVNNEVHLLEAPSNKLRMEWLSMLQMSRKRYYERNCLSEQPHGDRQALLTNISPELGNKSELNQNENEETEADVNQPSTSNCEVQIPEPQSTFYLSENGELNRHSLHIPDDQTTTLTRGCSPHFEELLARASAEAQFIESPTKRIINRARESMRRLSESRNNNTQASKECKCDRCNENLEISSQLRNRCFELTDELVATQDLVVALKKSLLTAHHQRDALAKICEESATVEDKLDVILERESVLTSLQCTVMELRREVEYYKEENRTLESENSSLNSMIDAFRESIRTKDELILKFYDNPNVKVTSPTVIQLRKRDSVMEEVPEAILFDFNNSVSDNDAKKVFSEASVNDITEMKDLVDGYCSQNKFLNNEVIELQKIIQSLEERERKLIRQNFDIEAVYYQLKSRYIMVLNHFRLSTHPSRFLDPTLVQNLINEVAHPSPISIKSPHQTNSTSPTTSAAGASSVIDPKSYAMLLSPYKNLSSVSTPTMDAETDSLGFYLNSPRSRCQTPLAMMTITKLTASIATATAANGDNVERSPSPSESSEVEPDSIASSGLTKSPPREALAITIESKEEEATKVLDIPSSSSGGGQALSLNTSQFFSTQSGDDWMVRVAADLKKRSDDIRDNIALASNKEYIEWLQRWDAFLVNHVLQPLPDPGPNSELKILIRYGIPHAYRSRIWKSLVFHYVRNTEAEMGKGYYECLLRKAENFRDKATDSALKQIDLDLGRTLPTNKQFDKEDSEKAQSLKRVLYAFRFHNKVVEYCQGLNRIAAIGLLYLTEADAFWFLVTCVEHLQPANYYNHNLLGAVIDQKILLDLVQKKLPALWDHFRKLDMDLSLFTLSWFLTVFVDALRHNIYINIFDVFLYEGNKVLFRFALALLKLCEPKVLECSSLTGVQACLSNLSALSIDYKTLANIAFKQLNPLSSKTIESRRQTYITQFKAAEQK